MTVTDLIPSAPAAAEARTVDLSVRSTLRGIEDLAQAIGLRRIATTTEELTATPGATIVRAAAVAAIRNPWADDEPGGDLDEETRRIAPVLAKLLTDRLIDVLGGAASVRAFGKAALVGVDGEIEHAAALIHTPYFGNLMREALEGTSILCFADGIARPGESIRVPMWHKKAPATRDYYQSIEVPLGDTPHPGEIVVIAAASTGPRPLARIGDRRTDTPVTSAILKGIQL